MIELSIFGSASEGKLYSRRSQPVSRKLEMRQKQYTVFGFIPAGGVPCLFVSKDSLVKFPAGEKQVWEDVVLRACLPVMTTIPY